MPLSLPLTIVAIDNVAHELTRLAIDDTLRRIDPAQVLILTDRPSQIYVPGADYYGYFDGNHAAAMRALWYSVPKLVRADHLLWLQWDSWVLDAAHWDDTCLAVDYVGAPWPVAPGNVWDELGYRPGRNVGNGGFSLRSTRLMRHLAANPERYPIQVPAEDDAVCRWHRFWLERDGFRWAESELAARFSFEVGPEVVVGSTFGFHGVFNWLWVLSRAEREARIAAASPYVLAHPGFRQVLEYHDLAPDQAPGTLLKFGPC